MLYWFLYISFLLGVSGSIFRAAKDSQTSSKQQQSPQNTNTNTDYTTTILATLKQCLDDKLHNRKFKKTTDKRIFMGLSGHTLEAMNAVSPLQIKQIQFLSDCVQTHAPHLFLHSESSAETYYRYGGSNVTFLSGIFPHLLPTVHSHLQQLLVQALYSASWKHAYKHAQQRRYGIRSAYVIAGERPGYDLFFHLIHARKHEALPPANKPLDISSDMPEEDAVLYQRFHAYLQLSGEDKRRHRARFVAPREGTEFTLYIALNDFHESCNADYLLHRHVTEADREMEKDDTLDSEEYEDLEDIAVPKEYEHLDLTGAKATKLEDQEKREKLGEKSEKRGDKTQESDNFFTDSYENYTPERGNALIIRGNRHGPNELLCGKRFALVVEYWAYNDAPMQTGVASLKQGQEELGLLPQPLEDKQDL